MYHEYYACVEHGPPLSKTCLPLLQLFSRQFLEVKAIGKDQGRPKVNVLCLLKQSFTLPFLPTLFSDFSCPAEMHRMPFCWIKVPALVRLGEDQYNICSRATAEDNQGLTCQQSVKSKGHGKA